jgi:hypothetical protein
MSEIKDFAHKLFEKGQERQELQELIKSCSVEELRAIYAEAEEADKDALKEVVKETLLEKARSHKYIRKEGVGEKAKYIYKEGEKKDSAPKEKDEKKGQHRWTWVWDGTSFKKEALAPAKKEDISDRELQILQNIQLTGIVGKMGNLSKKDRVNILQNLINRGLLNKNGS